MAKSRGSRKSRKKQVEEAVNKKQEKKLWMTMIGITAALLVLLYVIFMLNS